MRTFKLSSILRLALCATSVAALTTATSAAKAVQVTSTYSAGGFNVVFDIKSLTAQIKDSGNYNSVVYDGTNYAFAPLAQVTSVDTDVVNQRVYWFGSNIGQPPFLSFFGNADFVVAVDAGATWQDLITEPPINTNEVWIDGNQDFGFGGTATFAIASGPSSVPGPLPVLGAAAAFGASRRLRTRIKIAKASTNQSAG